MFLIVQLDLHPGKMIQFDLYVFGWVENTNYVIQVLQETSPDVSLGRDLCWVICGQTLVNTVRENQESGRY